MKLASYFVLLFLSPGILFAQELPPGTVLPVMLRGAVTAGSAPSGKVVHARVMQDVLAGGHVIIHAGAVLSGMVTRVDSQKGITRVSIRFDRLKAKSKQVPIITAFRAIASYVDVEQAQIPRTGLSRTVPYEAATFVLVGGDVSYRGGGPVMHGNEEVGKPRGDGVLVRVLPNAERGCATPADDNSTPQSLWVFSSNACGIYGLRNVSVSDRGLTSGEFTLLSHESEIKLHSGDGLLLTVISATR